MTRLSILAAVLALMPAPAAACSFCPGSATQATLRERFAEAKAVVLGTLKNPTFTNDSGAGSTEFLFDRVLKTDAVIEKRTSVVIPRYIPVIGKTPPAYLVFFDALDGKPDAVYGVPSTDGLAKYLVGVTALDPKQPAKRLAFFFDHLDSAETGIAEDAFQEFAKTPDADILAARGVLSPAKLEKLLTNPKTPPNRLGVFAMMLGLCGGEARAGTFAKLLTPPLSEAVSANLGGVLAGYAVCSPKAGWTAIRATLGDAKHPFGERLSALQAVRYFQATRPKEARAIVLDTYKLTLPDADLADIAIDDLRRWGWWDLSADVLAQYGKPTHTAPVFKKGIVRYALTCPEPVAKRFVDALRKTEPKLVADVEDGLKLFTPVEK
jgi:hypothetical protein